MTVGSVTEAPPDGFRRNDRTSPLTAPWEPIYARPHEDRVILGVWVREAHTNSRGMVHGGLISALADNAMGLSCSRRLGQERRLVTVRLSVDFLGRAALGQWLAFDTVYVKTGGTLCFAQAFVTADGEPCARADAVFKLIQPQAA